MSSRAFVILGAALAGLAVAAGAFGAHGLRDSLSAQQLDTYEVAVRYQMYHALALILVGLVARQSPSATSRFAGMAFLTGIAIFSGCLYLLVFTGQKWLGAVVPLGGLAFLIGWTALAIAAARQ